MRAKNNNVSGNHLEKCYTCEIQTEHVCLWLSVALCESTLITDELNEHLCFRGLAGRGHKNERQKRSQRRKLVQWQPGETSKLKYSCSWTNHSLFEVHSTNLRFCRCCLKWSTTVTFSRHFKTQNGPQKRVQREKFTLERTSEGLNTLRSRMSPFRSFWWKSHSIKTGSPTFLKKWTHR